MTAPDPVLVPPAVRAYMHSLGRVGTDWLQAVPAIVDRQAATWGLRLHPGPFLGGGTGAVVCRASTADGLDVVLKVTLPGAWLDGQVQTLLAARGRGYAMVLAHDTRHGALLLESLGRSLDPLTPDVPAALDVLVATLAHAWTVPPPTDRSRRPAEEHKATGLMTLVSTLATEHPGPALVPAVEQALRFARLRLADRDPGRQVVVHGDPHPENLLALTRPRPGADTGYVFIDPDGFLCEPEYDLGVTLREWNSQLLAEPDPGSVLRGWCRRLADRTATDAEAIWQWAFLERVATGLYLHHHGLPHLGAPFLTVSTRLANR